MVFRLQRVNVLCSCLFYLLLSALFSVVLSGCQCEDGVDCVVGDEEGAPQPPVVYSLTDQPYTTLQQLWMPKPLTTDAKKAITSGELTVYDHDHFHEYDIGAKLAEGIPWIEHKELAEEFVQGNAEQRKSLAYFWIVADPQVVDEESPIRMESFAQVYRPQGYLTPQVFEAHVRTAQRFSDMSSRPFDFALMAGDLTDGGQKNEVDWVLTTMNGGVIDPDSGVDNDPVPGPGNDHNDPFISDGLAAPWYAALGNHDSLYNGGFGTVTEHLRKAAVGDRLFLSPMFGVLGWHGFIPGDTVTETVITNPAIKTPPDEDRYPLTINEVIQQIQQSGGEPKGHGFTEEHVENAMGYYSVKPIAGKPVRMIVLHTTDSSEVDITLAFEGSLDREQFRWLESELDKSVANNELVIIMSHHRLSDFHRRSEVPSSEIEALFVSHSNVVLHLTGHGHKNTKTRHEAEDLAGEGDLGSGAFEHGGYWELMTASTMDFPMQSRIIEIVDENNGFVSIYVTNVDHNSPEDSLAHHARDIAAGKNAFLLAPVLALEPGLFWKSDVAAQNLLLRTRLPNSVQANLREYDWSNTIESESTLAALKH